MNWKEPVPLNLSFSGEIDMEIAPPVLEMSQKPGLEPEALMSAEVPAKLASGAQTKERSVAKATLRFMEER